MSTPADQQRLRDLRLLRQVKDRIDRDFAEPLNVEALAHGVHMSAGHLSREFKKAYGESPYSYFSTRFTELVGVPPSVYRQQAADQAAGIPSCVVKQVTRPVRNREAPVAQPQLT